MNYLLLSLQRASANADERRVLFRHCKYETSGDPGVHRQRGDQFRAYFRLREPK